MSLVARCSTCNKLLLPTQKYRLTDRVVCRRCGSDIAMGVYIQPRHKHRWETGGKPAEDKVVETTPTGYYYNLFYDEMCADCGEHRSRLWGGGGPFFVEGTPPRRSLGTAGSPKEPSWDTLDLTPEEKAAAKVKWKEVWRSP